MIPIQSVYTSMDRSLFYGWCTHGNDEVHICTESWDCPSCEIWRQSKKFRECFVVADRDFIYCIYIRREKTAMSAKSVVGIFNYKPTTLSDRRKANPEFTKCPFKNRPQNILLTSLYYFKSIGSMSHSSIYLMYSWGC